MKYLFAILSLLTFLSPIAFATPSESPQDHALRIYIGKQTLKTARSMLASSGIQKRGDRVKFSTPFVTLGPDDEVREINSSIAVESINGEPVAGGMSFQMRFLNGVLYSAKMNCRFCVE